MKVYILQCLVGCAAQVVVYITASAMFPIFLQGVVSSPEDTVDLVIEAGQIVSNSSCTAATTDVATESDVNTTEKAAESNLPEPKEQRQKQSRAGPIKAQKVKL